MLLKWLCMQRTPAYFMKLQRFNSTNLPELTQVRHQVKRGDFSTLKDCDVNFFESILGKKYVLYDDQQGSEDLSSFNTDFLKSVRGQSRLVLKPSTVPELSNILRYCNDRRLAVCPQGGNTGLVGGSVPVCDEIVLAMSRFNRILSVDEITGIVVCETGCILQELNDCVKEKAQLLVPLDLGAKSSCQLGGCLSTNAGGLRVLRYGNLHGSVLGVESVLANGEVLDLMSDFKKDNTGYHLKHLFIGAEGTLGILTKLAILCPPAPTSVHVAFLGLRDFHNVLETFRMAKRLLGEIMSSCELIDASSLDASVSHFNLNPPLQGYPFYMLIETSGSEAAHDLEKFNKFLERAMSSNPGNGERGPLVVDGVLTDEPGRILEIWKLRELIATALVRDGFCFKYDLSLPLRSFYDMVSILQDRVGYLARRVCGYGHLGDLNLHLNVSCDEYSEELYRKLEPYVYQETSRLKGSISAEHGIGFLKKNYLQYTKSPGAVEKMKQLKSILDPNGILNPYKVLQ